MVDFFIDKVPQHSEPKYQRKCRTCFKALMVGSYCVYTKGSLWLKTDKRFTDVRNSYFCSDKICFGSSEKGMTIRNVFSGDTLFALQPVPAPVVDTMKMKHGIIVTLLA